MCCVPDRCAMAVLCGPWVFWSIAVTGVVVVVVVLFDLHATNAARKKAAPRPSKPQTRTVVCHALKAILPNPVKTRASPIEKRAAGILPRIH